MRRADLIVSVSANGQEVLGVGLTRELFEDCQSGGVSPLKVIKKKDERVLFSRE
jgi:hypothetical protein